MQHYFKEYRGVQEIEPIRRKDIPIQEWNSFSNVPQKKLKTKDRNCMMTNIRRLLF